MVHDTFRSVIVTDLQMIGSVVGRVKRGKEWGIVDRSGDFVRTVFVDDTGDVDLL